MGIMVKKKFLSKFLLLLLIYSFGMFFGELLIDIWFDIKRDSFYKELLISIIIALFLAYGTMKFVRKK